MKHTSWLSALAAVRSPSRCASARTSAFEELPMGSNNRLSTSAPSM